MQEQNLSKNKDNVVDFLKSLDYTVLSMNCTEIALSTLRNQNECISYDVHARYNPTGESLLLKVQSIDGTISIVTK